MGQAVQLRSWHIVSGFGLFSAAAFGAQLGLQSFMSPHKQLSEEDRDGSCSRYDVLASRYDNAVSREENVIGTWYLRSWLVGLARGDCIEISAGTGRNLPYYPLNKRITSLTLTDLSLPMLERAEDKFHEELRLADKVPFQARFCLADSHCMTTSNGGKKEVLTLPILRKRMREGGLSNPGPGDLSSIVGPPQSLGRVWWKPWTYVNSPSCNCLVSGQEKEIGYRLRCKKGFTEDGMPLSRFPPASFDTVIDCFGLCSHDDPVLVLQEASRLCKPGGTILLLQHGRSHYNWLNSYLDDHAPKHHATWGCHWNKDINGIIQKAGLVVERASRWHLGTTYVVIARKPTVQESRLP